MRLPVLTLLCLVLVLLAARAEGPNTAPLGTISNPAILAPDSVATVFARRGMLTSVTILTEKPVEMPLAGGPEIRVVKDGNILHIQAVAIEGTSSINFRVDGITYVIKVKISSEDPVIPNPVFTIAKMGAFEDLDKALAASAPMKPSDIDLVGAIRTIERAKTDIAFKATLRNYAVLPINKVYAWNHCDITLVEAHQFADLDMIIFRVAWVNTMQTAFYLNAKQYKIFVGERPVMIQARHQLAPTSVIFPGQEEIVWLVVQGYKLRLDNNWNLGLPPDSSDLRAFIRN